MNFRIDDYVTRKSYNNDTVFKIVSFSGKLVILKGMDIRLYADAFVSDLEKCDYNECDDCIDDYIYNDLSERSDFFYLPAKILHIDGDKDYLNRCMSFYKNANVFAVGEYINERDVSIVINKLLKKYNPDIVVITGHDSISKKSKDIKVSNYKNSHNFVSAVKKAREFEKSHDKLVIIAGACQSDYESLIKAGANFASSPKRINIHALDPAIIAVNLALTEKNVEIDLIKLLEKTKYGHDGIGGLKSNGLMYVGYPR